MFSLDQVLRNTWSYLTVFGLRQLVKDGVQREAEIVEARPIFLGPFWVLGYNVMGIGCWPMGLPMFRPIL
jgi:hypothetical protein